MTGDVDYVLEYEVANGPRNKVAVVVAMQGCTFEPELAQCASYLGTAPKLSYIRKLTSTNSGYPSRERRYDPEEDRADRIWDCFGWRGVSVPASQR